MFLYTVATWIIILFSTNLVVLNVSAAGDANTVQDFDALDNLSIDIRQGDYALIRAHPSDETAQKQKEVCPDIISLVVSQVVDSNQEIKLKGKAAELLALCTTNNPDNRRAIGIANENAIHMGLVDLIRSGLQSISEEVDKDENSDGDEENDIIDIAATAIGNAAEAIWILTFADTHNHEGFMKANAIAALADVILVRDCFQECNRAIMWSAAALQNLAASYCKDEYGDPYCNWEWTKQKKLEINEDTTPITVDGQVARNLVLNHSDGNLVDELLWWICDAGPVIFRHHELFTIGNDDEIYNEEINEHESGDGFWYSWPSRATIQHERNEEEYKDDEYATSIVSWAAMGVIKNLALAGPEARMRILSSDLCDIEHALCVHAQSPDWLEEAKGLDAAYFLGFDLADCPPLYDEGCEDVEDWVDTQDGETCESFEENNYCLEFGDLVNEDGVSAYEACCVCGGGEGEGEDGEDEDYEDDEDEDYEDDEDEDEDDGDGDEDEDSEYDEF